MTHETTIKQLVNHINNGQCTLCIKMGWKKDCPFENIPEVKQMDYKEEDNFFRKHFDELDGKCKEYLGNKLSTNIKIENKKIETTKEGSNFLNMFFNDLQNFLPKMNKV